MTIIYKKDPDGTLKGKQVNVHTTSRIVKGGDLNGTSNLFGGRALEWIDEDAALAAFLVLGTSSSIVTKAMSSIVFQAPARHGDIVTTYCSIEGLGNSSIKVKCVMRNRTTDQDIIVVEEIVLVNLDHETGRPSPHGYTLERNLSYI